MNEEEIFKMLLVESIDKFPLLNELFAIRDSRGKRNDYTIFVNGYISLDVINEAVEKVNLLDNLKEIEKSHQEENGKLRVELEQYKLLEANIDKANKIIAENKFDEGLYGLLMQEKEKGKELYEALERSSGHITQLTVENSDLKYQLYHKQQMIDELTQNEEKLKIELGKEKEKNKELEHEILKRQWVKVDENGNIEQKTIESLKRYINSQEQKLDDYYRMDEEFYKDEIEQLELSLKLLRTVLNHLKQKDHELNYQKNYCTMVTESKDDIIKTMAERITKQEKMIELMALAISSYDGQLVINQYKDRNDVKAKFEEYVEDGTYEQYFEKKAEENK